MECQGHWQLFPHLLGEKRSLKSPISIVPFLWRCCNVLFEYERSPMWVPYCHHFLWADADFLQWALFPFPGARYLHLTPRLPQENEIPLGVSWVTLLLRANEPAGRDTRWPAHGSWQWARAPLVAQMSWFPAKDVLRVADTGSVLSSNTERLPWHWHMLEWILVPCVWSVELNSHGFTLYFFIQSTGKAIYQTALVHHWICRLHLKDKNELK